MHSEFLLQLLDGVGPLDRTRCLIVAHHELLERLGNALGPLIASILVIFWGYQGAFIAISALVLFCGIAFTIATRGTEWAAEPAAGDD